MKHSVAVVFVALGSLLSMDKQVRAEIRLTNRTSGTVIDTFDPGENIDLIKTSSVNWRLESNATSGTEDIGKITGGWHGRMIQWRSIADALSAMARSVKFDFGRR